MKVKNGFMLRAIAGQWVIIPLGARVVEFNGIMTLSESGAILWRLLENGAEVGELVAAILAEYDIDAETAERDVNNFLDTIGRNDLFEKSGERNV